MKVTALLDVGQLEEIYELTYKYGWLVSEERNKGWLPDRANMEKLKIKSRLDPLLTMALEDLGEGYEEWLRFHRRDGWIEQLLEMFESEGSAVITKDSYLLRHWGLHPNILFDVVAEAPSVKDSYYYHEQENILEDLDFYLEAHAEEFLDQVEKDKPEFQERIDELREEEFQFLKMVHRREAVALLYLVHLIL